MNMRSIAGAVLAGAAAGWLVSRLPVSKKHDFAVGPDQNDPYMLRWYLLPRNKWFNIYLHKFLHSDYDGAKHDHPYHNMSVLLRGSYLEHIGDFNVKQRNAGYIVLRRAATPHRIELLLDSRTCETRPVWTLFITGPRIREWGFHCPQGWRPWHMIAGSNYGQAIRGCEDIP